MNDERCINEILNPFFVNLSLAKEDSFILCNTPHTAKETILAFAVYLQN
jgi:hypothetical protein